MARILRATVLVLLAVLALAVLATADVLVWLNTGWGREYLRGRIAAAAPGLSLKQVQGFVPFDVVVHGIDYAPPGASYQVTIKSLEIRPNIWRSIEQRHIVIATARVVAPSVTQRRATAREAPAASSQPSRSTTPVVVQRFEVVDGGAAGRAMGALTRVLDVNAGGSAAYGPRGLSLHLRSLAATIVVPARDLRVTLAGDASIPPLASVEGRASPAAMEVNIGGTIAGLGDAEPLRYELAARGPLDSVGVTLRMLAPPAGSVYLRGWVNVTSAAHPYAAALNADNIDPNAVAARLPAGALTLSAAVNGHGEPLAATSAMQAKMMVAPSRLADVPIQEAGVRFESHGESWHLADAHAHTAGLAAQAEGDGSGHSLAVSARVTTADDGRGFREGDVRVRGTLTAQVEGEVPNHLHARARGVLAQVQSKGLRARGIRVSAQLTRAAGATHGIARLFVAEARSVPTQHEGGNTGGTALQTGARRLQLVARLAPRQLAVVVSAKPLVAAPNRGAPNARLSALPPVSLAAVLPLRHSGAALPSLAPAGAQPFTAQVVWGDVPIQTLQRALGENATAGGTLDLRLLASGVLARPKVELAAHVVRPRIGATMLPPLAVSAMARLAARQTVGRLVAVVGDRPLLRARGRLAAGTNDLTKTTPAMQHARLHLEATIPPYPLAQLSRLAPVDNGSRPPISGTLEGSLRVSGSAAAPSGQGTLRLSDAAVGDSRFGTLVARANGSLASGAAHAEASAWQGPTNCRTLQATIDYDSGRGLEVQAQAHGLDLAAVQALAPPLKSLAPTVDGRLAVHGRFGPEVPAQPVVRPPPARVAQGSAPGASASRPGAGPAPRARAAYAGGRDGEPRAVPTKRALILTADISDARLGLVLRPTSKKPEGKKGQPKGESAPTRAHQELLQAYPLEVQRLQVRDSELQIIDATKPEAQGPPPVLSINHIELSLENLGNRPTLVGRDPSVLAVRAAVQQHGSLMAFATLDPTTPRPTLAGEAEVRGLSLTNMEGILRQTTGLEATSGTFNCFVQFIVVNGHISGGIKPELQHANVKPGHASLLSAIKSALANVTLDIFHNEVPGRNGVATVIPIEGTLAKPNVQLVPSALGILRNAFVVGLAGGFSHLPPVKAAERQNLIQQATSALNPENGPPKAQPQSHGE